MSPTPLFGVVLGLFLWGGAPSPQDPGFVVEGRVVQKNASGGIGDVAVELIGSNSADGLIAAARTTDDGEFRFSGIHAGGYTVRVLRDGYRPRSQYVHVDEDVALILPLSEAPVSRDGVADDAGNGGRATVVGGVVREGKWGLPLSGVDVLTSDGRATRTGPFGTFRLPGVSRDRPLLLHIHPFGYLPLDTIVSSRGGGPHEFQLVPDPAVQRRIDREVSMLKRRSEGRSELVAVMNREALLASHAPSVEGRIRALYPDRVSRIACVVVDDGPGHARSTLTKLRPGDLQRVELFHRSGNPGALVARIYTRSFIRDLVAGGVEADAGAFDYLHGAGRGSEDPVPGPTCPP